MVANQDYFVLNGLINISNIVNGQHGAFTMFYRNQRTGKDAFIDESRFLLYKKTCSDVDSVKIDSCDCTFMDSNYVRLKCNLTARTLYSRSQIALLYSMRGWYLSTAFQMPPVYETPGCTDPSTNRAARNHPESFTALLGM
ncbi:unnamed protein product [Lymnaea stagnalis]|uniref:Uncharacterized protein n=1 Tax=Lymnaea stagnalis TaxID=6523 RepID=A0AAV2IRC4_LYMST